MITDEKLDDILTNDRRNPVTDVRAALLLALDIRKELTRIADALEARSQSTLRPRDVVPPFGPGPGYSPPGALR